MGPGLRRERQRRYSLRHRKAQGFAAARHVDGGKAGGGEAAGAAIALLIDLELAFAGAQRGGAAPLQRLVLELDGAIVGVDRFGETENLLGLADNIGMQAFTGLDPVPAAAGQ